MTKTLKRAHKGVGKVRDSGEAPDYHECRKRCKYHWYHLRVLRGLLDDGNRLHRFAKLGDLIGDAHDRSVLLGQLNALPEFLKRNMSVQRVAVDAICERRKLRRKALGLCDGLFDEKPESFAATVENELAKNRDIADDRRDPGDRADTLSIA